MSEKIRPKPWRGMPYWSVGVKDWRRVGVEDKYGKGFPADRLNNLRTLMAGEDGCPLLPEEYQGTGWVWCADDATVYFHDGPCAHESWTPIPDHALHSVLTWTLNEKRFSNGRDEDRARKIVENGASESPQLPPRDKLYDRVKARSNELKTLRPDGDGSILPDHVEPEEHKKLYQPRSCPTCGLKGCAHLKKAEDPKKIILPRTERKHYRHGIVIPHYHDQARVLSSLKSASNRAVYLNDPRAVELINEALQYMRKRCEVDG